MVIKDNKVTLGSNTTIQGDLKVEGVLEVTKHIKQLEQYDTLVLDDLSVAKNAYIDNNLIVDKEVSIGKNTQIDRDLNVDGSITLGNDMIIDGDIKATDGKELNLLSNTYISKDLEVNNDLLVQGDLEVNADASVLNLSVKSNTTLENAVINGNLTLKNGLILDSVFQPTRGINVTEGMSSLKQTTIAGNLDVTSGTVNINNDLIVDSDKVELNKNTIINAELDVNCLKINGKKFTGEVNHTDLSIATDLTVSGLSTLNVLKVTDNMSVQNTATIGSHLFLPDESSILSVAGSAYVSKDLNVGSDLRIDGQIYVNDKPSDLNFDTSDGLSISERIRCCW